jgi:hypothetical protein
MGSCPNVRLDPQARDPQARSEIEPDWEQRLATEHKRLRQLAGAM